MQSRPEQWRQTFQEDGFVIVADLLDPESLARLREGMDRITADPDRLPPRLRAKIFLEREHVRNNPQWYAGTLAPEDCGQAVRQIADLALFGPAFAELICYPPLLDVLEALFASPEFSFHAMFGRPKAARVGNGISNGNYHRDTPFEEFTSANTIEAVLCLDPLGEANGATSFLRGSHRVTDAEAAKPCWREVPAGQVDLSSRVPARCPAGAGIFFTSKILHAAGHNRSEYPRRTIFSEWIGPDVLPVGAARNPYEGLRPRSRDPLYQKQMRLTFPQRVGGTASVESPGS
jgi:ectoine hydroxylase-related dioxygenase (phytanoyl-CoA dioxygenase family)